MEWSEVAEPTNHGLDAMTMEWWQWYVLGVAIQLVGSVAIRERRPLLWWLVGWLVVWLVCLLLVLSRVRL